MDLKEMINEMVERRVAGIIDEMMQSNNDRPGVATVASNYREKGENTRSIVARRTMEREIAETETEQPARRRRRVRRPRVGYIVVTNNRGRYTDPTDLFETAEIVFRAIVKAKLPMSQPELERVTGLKRKTVESCVWYLRRHDATGATVKDGKGLITASPLDA
jgi:hypothetical protein